MMNYETFKKEVTKIFMDYMPEPYRNQEIKIQKIYHPNHAKDGIVICDSSSKRTALPVAYLNDMYDQYIKCHDLRKVAECTVKHMLDNMFDTNMLDLAAAKDNIVFELVNTEQNKEMLAEVPHREFLDLSIIYRWIISRNSTETLSAVVRNRLASSLGLTEEDLFKLAWENTRRLLPPVLLPLDEMIPGSPQGNPSCVPKGLSMWALSNQAFCKGAASMLYQDKLQEMAEQLGDGFYILPSSVHEVMLVNGIDDADTLAQIVQTANMECVSVEEWLSNQAYYYDKDLKKVVLATDTPNKELS